MRKYLGLLAASLLVGCSANVCGDGSDASALQEELNAKVGNQVYFRFDHPRPGDHMPLDAANENLICKQADWLKNNERARIHLHGHCDERGPEEYNLALGERRADAVKNGLIAKGVDASRLETRSFGKGNPPVPAGSVPGMHEEDRHARNRVVVLNVSVGDNKAAEESSNPCE